MLPFSDNGKSGCEVCLQRPTCDAASLIGSGGGGVPTAGIFCRKGEGGQEATGARETGGHCVICYDNWCERGTAMSWYRDRTPVCVLAWCRVLPDAAPVVTEMRRTRMHRQQLSDGWHR